MASSPGSSVTAVCTANRAKPLPSYIARHFDMGFDADDVSALLSCIDASQDRTSTPRFPQLPAEILFQIVEHVPIDYVLQWRLVCRAFRDCIDGPYMYGCLRRAEIIGLFASPTSLEWAGIEPDVHEILTHMRCSFERFGDPHWKADRRITTAKWEGQYAIFSADGAWQTQFLQCDKQLKDSGKWPNWNYLRQRLQFDLPATDSFGKMRWCMRLDAVVLDLEYSIETLQDKLSVDLLCGKGVLVWKDIFIRFIKSATELRIIMEQKRKSDFSFGYEEDCLRELRRRRLRDILNKKHPNDSMLRWGLSTLPPLFGRRAYHEPADEFTLLKTHEEKAIEALMPLRKEAAMSTIERDRLWQLAKDYSDMNTALHNLHKTYNEWKSTLAQSDHVPCSIRTACLSNPFTWSEEVMRRRETRVLKWKAQRENLLQVASLLKDSIDIVSVPENAFDDLGSDI